MIKGLEIIDRSGKDGRITHFTYRDIGYWLLTSEFENMKDVDFERLYNNSLQENRKWGEAKRQVEIQRAAMTPEERAGWDEADRAVFERWQDESNTNAILDGYKTEGGEDPDFNPFRKDLSL